MDAIWSPNSLGLFLAFFIPGFISQKVYGLFVADAEPDSSTVVLNAIGYSCLTYAITAPLVWLLLVGWPRVNLVFLTLALVLIFIVIPVALPIGWLQLRKQSFISDRTISPIRRPWDFVFARPGGYWAVVTFKDGSKIAGLYRENSFSSHYPQPEQIYLEKVWNLDLDGSFLSEVPDSQGAIIVGDEILTIELFTPKEVNHG